MSHLSLSSPRPSMVMRLHSPLLPPIRYVVDSSGLIREKEIVRSSSSFGGVAGARAFAKKLSDAPLAIVDKRRHCHNVAELVDPPSIRRLSSELFQEVIITNTIPLSEKNYFPQLTLQETIWRGAIKPFSTLGID